MSLNWDVRNCDESVKDEKNWSITEIIIFATMSVDMGEITEQNVDTFIARVRAIETVYGPSVVENTKDGLVHRGLTEEEIRLRIGLKTNVTTTSDVKFRNRMAKALMERSARR